MTTAYSPRITIDTNCVVGLFDTKSQTATSTDELRELVRYALSGVIELCITTRVEVDFGRDNDNQRRKDMLKHISMLPVIGTVARWDVSKWDGGDVMADPKQKALVDEIQRIVFPGLTPESGRYANKIADIDHLAGHSLGGRDVFVTDDKDILRRYDQFRDAVGICVMSPANASNLWTTTVLDTGLNLSPRQGMMRNIGINGLRGPPASTTRTTTIASLLARVSTYSRRGGPKRAM